MRIKSFVAAGLALAAAVSPVSAARLSPEDKLAKALEGRVAGEPVNCIPFTSARSSQIIDGQAIIYKSGAGGTIYVNRPRIGADQLDDDDILVTSTSLSQLCSLDTIQLVDRASRFPRGFVGLDKFVPYKRVAKR
ncbi:hypothetical protein [Sphingomonas jatrophae]|uniref:Uncharacterized protein n=1 Tax=Sphingomonas jatrophae TaxID=1166337 RepID=A0A1I6JIG6_9SPHN|nr:hypothetical protein [Sphingomonas jatrophae]SFR78684.1 hypothetical protein SAMN05192580_0307 [Sphingomonas jatrophae]